MAAWPVNWPPTIESQARVQVGVECNRPQWSTSVTVRRFAEPSAAGPLA